MLEKEYQERETSEDESSEEEEEREWDCQSILSTYTNTDNHPAVIKTVGRVVKTKQRMELHKQFKVPLEGLMAEEITIVKEKPKKPAKALVEADDSSDDADEEKGGNESKAARKKQMKQEKREKRKLKKELKIAFQSQNSKLVKQTTAELGALRAGVSVKKIY